MEIPPRVTWRPYQPGEDIRQWSATVDSPMRFWNVVDHIVSLPDNPARARAMSELKRKQGKELVDAVRRAAWDELRRRSSST